MTILGKDINTDQPVSINVDARSRGIYVIGTTGTGKTTLLQSIAYQDMKAGHGLCVLDAHGDMTDWLLERVPKERLQDVILFDPSDLEFPIGLNILECNRNDPRQVRRVVDNFVSSLGRIFELSWGPRLEHVLSHTLWTAMTIPDSTILEVLLLLTDTDYRDKHTKDLQEPLLKNFWKEFPDDRARRQQFELVGSTVNKLTPFLLDRQMRNIVGQSKSSLNLRSVMDEQKILLVNLSKGDLGENNSALLGTFLINMILVAALSRRDMSLQERQAKPFHVIVDEYQNFASQSFSTLQSEARKYAVDLVVAHQFRDQLLLENKGSALNVGNFVSFRTTGIDGLELSSQFDNTPPQADPVWEPIRVASDQWQGYYERGKVDQQVPGNRRLYSDVMMQTANELTNLYPYRAKVKVIIDDPTLGRSRLQEYLVDTWDSRNEEYASAYYGLSSPSSATRIRKQSRLLARPRAEVDTEITERTGGAADANVDPDSQGIASHEVIK